MPFHLPILQFQMLAAAGSVAKSKEAAKTDCSYCRAPCCQLLVELQPHELDKYAHEEYMFEEGPRKILARRPEDGYCVYFVHGQGCSTYDDKPKVCDFYSCRDDNRITPSDKYGKIQKRI